MANNTIPQYTAAVSIDQTNDYLLIYNNSATAYRKINRNTLLSITGSPVGTTDTQTLSSKTLTNPTINSAVLSGTLSGTYMIGGTPTFPSSVVTLTGTQALTNKTLTSPVITGGTIDNTTITVDSISGHTTSTIVTVGGVQMNNGVIGTSGAVTSSSIAAGAVQPQALVSGTGTGWSWSSWTPTYGNLTIGNGTVEAKYTQIGKTVFARFFFQLGSTSAVGNVPTISPPITPLASYYTTFGTSANVGYSRSVVGGGGYLGNMVFLSATTITSFVLGATATYVGEVGMSSTIPATWATGNQLFWAFSYEVA